MSSPRARQARIEPAVTPAHLREIAGLARVVWQAHYPGIISQPQIDYMLGWMYDPSTMRAEVEQGIEYHRLVAEGRLIGFSSFGPSAESGDAMKLHKLYLHPEYQRCGLGKLLARHAEAAARMGGFARLVLAVNKANERAIAAYQKYGFTIREETVKEIGRGFVMDDFVMEKSVSARET